MDADAMDRLHARMEHMESSLQRMVGLLDQVMPQVAMAVDIADDWAASRLGGDRIEERLAKLEDALVRVTEPATLEGLVRLAELGPRLHRVAELATTFDDTVAMGVDVADDWVQQELGGDELDRRLGAAKQALLVLTAPDVLASLTRMAVQAPDLERLVSLGASFDDTVAMAVDVADGWIRDQVGGDSLDARLGSLGAAAIAFTEPDVLQTLRTLAELAPRLVGTARIAADLEGLLSTAASSLEEPAEPVGFFGLLSALRDPEIQRGLGRVLHLTRLLGRNETLLPTKR